MHPVNVTLPLLLRSALLLATAVALGACSSTDGLLSGDKIDYKSQGVKTAPLDIPPDLTQLQRDSRYQPQSGGAVSASTYGSTPPRRRRHAGTGAGRQQRATATATATATTTPTVDTARRRQRRQALPAHAGDDGGHRARPAPLRRPASARCASCAKATSAGCRCRCRPSSCGRNCARSGRNVALPLVIDNPDTGVMETDWAENRAKIPLDAIRRTLGRALDTLYDTGERDRFRMRVERNAGGSDVFLSHRGMVEIYTNERKDFQSTIWTQRPSDPELEAEMLTRLMVKLGAKEEVARARSPRSRPPRPACARARRAAGRHTASRRRLRPRLAPCRPDTRPQRLHRRRPRPRRRPVLRALRRSEGCGQRSRTRVLRQDAQLRQVRHGAGPGPLPHRRQGRRPSAPTSRCRTPRAGPKTARSASASSPCWSKT